MRTITTTVAAIAVLLAACSDNAAVTGSSTSTTAPATATTEANPDVAVVAEILAPEVCAAEDFILMDAEDTADGTDLTAHPTEWGAAWGVWADEYGETVVAAAFEEVGRSHCPERADSIGEFVDGPHSVDEAQEHVDEALAVAACAQAEAGFDVDPELLAEADC